MTRDPKLPRVKICGITRPEDARLAIDLGAWALGLMFYPGSSRALTIDAAKVLVDAVRASHPTTKAHWVGVFVNQPTDEVQGIADAIGLDYAQLHGDETLEDIAALTVPVIKAVRTKPSELEPELEQAQLAPYRSRCPLMLVDSYSKDAYGGTGKVADWQRARAFCAEGPTLLAGGITPANAAQALAEVQPFGLDLSSGVEHEPGIKDHDKLRQLFGAISPELDHSVRRHEP